MNRLIPLLVLLVCPSNALAQDTSTVGVGQWLTLSSNLDAGYRRTQFFRPRYDTTLLNTESRVEVWLPPFRSSLSWGPYLRLAAITSSRDQPWENAWLGAPGVGVQVYPFSGAGVRAGTFGRLLGPLRVFAEYDLVKYWGAENDWRPTEQTRIGIDYWRALYVNSHARPWWAETWHGLTWNSSNEFSPDYDTTVLANVVRAGVRKSGGGVASVITPYGAIESSWTKNDAYYWENRLLLGGGMRVAPILTRQNQGERVWLARIVFYGEYLRAAAYYRAKPESSLPRFDARVGISASIGDWYK
jgi:hypothetical protein